MKSRKSRIKFGSKHVAKSFFFALLVILIVAVSLIAVIHSGSQDNRSRAAAGPGICKDSSNSPYTNMCSGYTDVTACTSHLYCIWVVTVTPTPTPTRAPVACKTSAGWIGTCTLGDNYSCNSSKPNIAWDGSVTACKAISVPNVSTYGCCGDQMNFTGWKCQSMLGNFQGTCKTSKDCPTGLFSTNPNQWWEVAPGMCGILPLEANSPLGCCYTKP